MAISYKPLWKLLIDQNMKKKDLIALSGISQSSVSKMGRGENVNTDILNRICIALHCGIADIMEVIPEGNEEPSSTRIINCKSEVERKHRFRKNVIRTEAGPPHVFPWGKHDTPLLPESARQIDSFVEGDYQARSRSGSNGTSLQCQCGFQTVLVCGIQKSNEPSQSGDEL